MIKVQEFRGHIRNWEELCERLGISLDLSREEREEEILVRAYETWGYEMADHMHGMFAFALWDDREEKLFCLRDHFGTKPFYYYETADGKLLYGTMIRQIMEQPGFVKELNEEMLQIYLSLTYVAGENTFFRGLKKLMPGHYLIWQNGKLKVERYWTPEFHPDESKSLEEWADEIHNTLREIMPEVKAADETAESFLSGGVDSSYVLAMSDAEISDSCGYDEARFDESGLAKQTADILGRKNLRCLITPEEYFAIVPYVMYNMEQPLGDASAIAFTIACNETAKHTKLCYSGEGADEFFGGYNVFVAVNDGVPPVFGKQFRRRPADTAGRPRNNYRFHGYSLLLSAKGGMFNRLDHRLTVYICNIYKPPPRFCWSYSVFSRFKLSTLMALPSARSARKLSSSLSSSAFLKAERLPMRFVSSASSASALSMKSCVHRFTSSLPTLVMSAKLPAQNPSFSSIVPLLQ